MRNLPRSIDLRTTFSDNDYLVKIKANKADKACIKFDDDGTVADGNCDSEKITVCQGRREILRAQRTFIC